MTDLFKKHPKPWRAEPMWRSTKTPWVVRDGHRKEFITADDEETAREIEKLGAAETPS